MFQINFVFIRVRSLQAKWIFKWISLLVWAHVTLNLVWTYIREQNVYNVCYMIHTQYEAMQRFPPTPTPNAKLVSYNCRSVSVARRLPSSSSTRSSDPHAAHEVCVSGWKTCCRKRQSYTAESSKLHKAYREWEPNWCTGVRRAQETRNATMKHTSHVSKCCCRVSTVSFVSSSCTQIKSANIYLAVCGAEENLQAIHVASASIVLARPYVSWT